ncbi:MAG: hypothetical protein QE164_02560 [Candidatus Nezhaarchaeota archaeon]|nr:hypothetical protein [Candidatus Nezhaarchaeota archaeon]
MGVVKCPYCGFDGGHKLLKTWKYNMWDVYFYECSQCKKRFRYQVDPEGKRKSYVLRLGLRRGK